MISYRSATLQDNAQLLELTRATGMSGTIALRSDREPDFFGIMMLRGPSTVYVAVDGERVIGSICVSREAVFENGAVCPLYYISDFKVHPEYRNRGIGLQLTCEVVDFLVEHQADLVLLHVAHGNRRPFVFFKDRTHYPDFENIGTFRIIQFPGARTRSPLSPNILELSPSEEVLKFLNDFYRTRQLARIVTQSDLEGVQIFGFFEKGEIQSILCLQDTEAFKQHVITKMPVVLRGVVSILNWLRPITHTTRLPRVGEPIRMLYIKYLAAPHPNRNVIRHQIRHARQVAYDGSYAFLSLGLHERDPLLEYLPGLYRLVFKSTGMLVSMQQSSGTLRRVHAGIPFKDFSSV